LKIEDYPRNLQMLVNQHIWIYMEASSKPFLIYRAKQLQESIKRGRKKHGKWAFSIPPDKPLAFRRDDINLQVDIYGKMEGVKENITKQCFNLRIWSFDKKVCYREKIDAPEVKEKIEPLGWKRVILRFHFDLKNLEEENLEPLFHLHVGGHQKDEENCWLNEKISVPRFAHPPMDLILLCEFVLMNFFPEKYRNLKDDPEWISLIRKSQELFQAPYFKDSMRYINDESNTLLGNLVSSRGVTRDE
jgi:hypothetical protein